MAEKTHMNRHNSRKTVFTLLYTKEFYPELDGREFLQASAEAAESTYNVYIVDTFLGAASHQAEIDKEIETYAVKWKVSRMAKVTRSILRLAVFEMLFAQVSTPPKVLINEAVELAKEYDDDVAPTFINGILHRVALEHGLFNDQQSPADISDAEQSDTKAFDEEQLNAENTTDPAPTAEEANV